MVRCGTDVSRHAAARPDRWCSPSWCGAPRPGPEAGGPGWRMGPGTTRPTEDGAGVSWMGTRSSWKNTYAPNSASPARQIWFLLYRGFCSSSPIRRCALRRIAQSMRATPGALLSNRTSLWLLRRTVEAMEPFCIKSHNRDYDKYLQVSMMYYDSLYTVALATAP